MEPSYVTRSTAYKLFPRSWSTLPLPSMFLPCCFLPATTTVYVSILFPSHMTKHSRKQRWSSPHTVSGPRLHSHSNTISFYNAKNHTFPCFTITHNFTFTLLCIAPNFTLPLSVLVNIYFAFLPNHASSRLQRR